MKGNYQLAFDWINDYDMFGRKIELYYKGRAKKTSLIGLIFTSLYVTIFLVLFIYKLIKMLKKSEALVYDVYTFVGRPPSIDLTNENFYGGFALEDPITYDTFIDEEIYYPKAYFKRAERDGDKWKWFEKEIELEKCKLEKFGSSFQNVFKKTSLNTLYCFKEMNETFIGHFSYDIYSFFFISFYPCKNTTDNKNKCKSKELMDYYLKSTFIAIQMQDVEMTPQNNSSPLLQRIKDVYTTVGKNLFKDIHIYFQIVNLETDVDLFGFENFQKVEKKTVLKYDYSSIMTNIIENDVYETGESFCNVTLKLSDKVLTEKRTYTKLIEILGNVGGFMQVLYTLLRIMSSSSIKILYHLSLVNDLFEFNIDKKLCYINTNRKYNKNNKFFSQRICIPISPMNKFSMKLNQSLSKGKDFSFNKSSIENNLIDKNSKNDEIINKIAYKNSKLRSDNDILYKDKDNNDIKIFNFNMNNINYNLGNIKKKEKEKEIEIKSGRLIQKIKLNKLCVYFCFFLVRKRKNIQNILLDEGIQIIHEELDISNIFKKLHKEKGNKDIKDNNDNIINMSYKCKKNLEKVRTSIIYI